MPALEPCGGEHVPHGLHKVGLQIFGWRHTQGQNSMIACWAVQERERESRVESRTGLTEVFLVFLHEKVDHPTDRSLQVAVGASLLVVACLVGDHDLVGVNEILVHLATPEVQVILEELWNVLKAWCDEQIRGPSRAT